MAGSVQTDDSEHNFEQSSPSDGENFNTGFHNEFSPNEYHKSELPTGSFSRLGKRTYGSIETKDPQEARYLRRRTSLEQNLQAFREILPEVKTFLILADTFNYIDELRDISAKLKLDLHATKPEQNYSVPPEDDFKNQNIATDPLVEVIKHQAGLQIHVCCVKWPGQLVAILEALQEVGLNVMQASVVSQNKFIFDALCGTDQQCGENGSGELKCEDVKTTILQKIKERKT